MFFSLSSWGDYIKILPGSMARTSATPYYPPKVALKPKTFEKRCNIVKGETSLLLIILKGSFNSK
jgi:hypothetical protein